MMSGDQMRPCFYNQGDIHYAVLISIEWPTSLSGRVINCLKLIAGSMSSGNIIIVGKSGILPLIYVPCSTTLVVL